MLCNHHRDGHRQKVRPFFSNSFKNSARYFDDVKDNTSLSRNFGMCSFSVASFFIVGAWNNSAWKYILKSFAITWISTWPSPDKSVHMYLNQRICTLLDLDLFMSKKEFSVRQTGHFSFFLLTGSTLSQLLYFPTKSKLMTWPQTEVNFTLTFSPVAGNLVVYSWMEHAPLEPFLVPIWPLERIFASEAAREGFSATIKMVFMVPKGKELEKSRSLLFTQKLSLHV